MKILDVLNDVPDRREYRVIRLVEADIKSGEALRMLPKELQCAS